MTWTQAMCSLGRTRHAGSHTLARIEFLSATADFRIFEKSQFAVDLPVDNLNEQNVTETGFSSRMHMHRDEKLISVAFYSFKSFTEWFTASRDFSNIVKSTVPNISAGFLVP